MDVLLSQPGVDIPPDVITNKDLERLVDTSDEWIIRRTGITERRISFYKSNREMGAEAAKNLLNIINLDPEEIDEIMYATNRHDDDKAFPNHGSYVAEAIGARDGIPFSNIDAGCTGLIYAIKNAHDRLVANKFTAEQFNKKNGKESGKIHRIKKILVVAVERLTDMTDYSDRTMCVLFGDGACAYLVELSEDGNNSTGQEEGIINCVIGGLPDRGYKNNWPNGYLGLEKRKGIKLVSKINGEFQTKQAEQLYIGMDGQEIMKYAIPAMVNSVHDVLRGTGYGLSDIDVIVPHSANIRIINNATKKFRQKGFKGEVYTTIEKHGNTSSASIGLSDYEARQEGIIKKGDKVIMVGFGAGLTNGAVLSIAR